MKAISTLPVRCKSRCTPSMKVSCFVILLSFGSFGSKSGVVHSQSICSADSMRAYESCILGNSPCPCDTSKCDANPTDGTPVVFVDAPLSCNDIFDIFCPMVRCCSVCQTEALGWYQCAADNVSQRWLDQSCDLEANCDVYPTNDLDSNSEQCGGTADEAPTVASKPVKSPTSNVKVPVATLQPSMRPSTLAPVAQSAILRESLPAASSSPPQNFYHRPSLGFYVWIMVSSVLFFSQR